MSNKSAFAVTARNAAELKVLMNDATSIVLTDNPHQGYCNIITLTGLTAPQVASLIETFGRWEPATVESKEVVNG